jgi:hypothetical protein
MIPPASQPTPTYLPIPPVAPRNGSATIGIVFGIIGIAFEEVSSFASLVLFRVFAPTSVNSLIALSTITGVVSLALSLLTGILAVTFGAVGWHRSRALLPLQVGRVQSAIGITLGIVLLGRIVATVLFYLVTFLEYRLY